MLTRRSAQAKIGILRRLMLWGLALLLNASPALASQGPGVGEGTAGPAERALALAFILALPLTLLAIGLRRRL